MKHKKITIVDYGVGNIHSVMKAFRNYDDSILVSEQPSDIESADALIMPGVGSFESGIEGLKIRNLVEPLKNFAAQNKPILGICLGAQLMLTTGYEFGEFSGLNLIPGKVVKFPSLPEKEKIPHIGWNKIYPLNDSEWQNSLLESIPINANLYFVHSYILQPERKENILSLTNYGGYEFCSAVKFGNIYGCQFHPEKSGTVGAEIIKNFINII